MPKFGPEFWVRLKHPNSRINQYQPGTNLYQSGIKLYQTGTILYQTGTNLYQSRFSYTDKDSVGHIKFKEGGDYLKEANTCDG